MTDISPESAPGGPGDERVPDDLSSLFADPDRQDLLEKMARHQVRGTRAGRADATTGSEHEIPLPVPPVEAAGGGLIFDDEDQDDAVPSAARPWTWRDAFPAGTFDSAAWAHRKRVFLHRLAWHAGHSHVYAWRLTRLSGLGVVAGARDSWHYYSAQEYADMVDTARRKKLEPDIIAALREERLETARGRRREPLLVGATTAVLTVIAAAVAVADVYGLLAASPAAVLLLGILSGLGLREHQRRNPDEALSAAFNVQAASLADHAPLTDDLLNRVLRIAKVFTKDEHAVTLLEPIRPAEINGIEAKFKLPDNIQVSKLLAAKEAIAGALDIEEHWLDIKQDGSPTRVSFWYCTSDPFGAPRISPLVAAPERQDVWNRGILIGFNRRGLPVYLKLRHVMALLGGMSRTGKGMLLRNLIVGLGLDPRINLRLVAGAKPGEHRGYAPICSTFFGRRPDRLIDLLEGFLREAYRREGVLEDQGRAKFGEKDLDEFPLEILIIDEYKQYANSSMRIPDPNDDREEGPRRTIKACDRIAELLEEIAAFAAALNMTVLISTQDPDANTVPRGYKSNTGARAATRTGGAVQTNAILKDGATGAGLRAHEIPESLKGGAIVDIDGAPGELIRSYFIEDEEFDGAADLIAAGLELRQELDRAPGQFVDEIENWLIAVTGASSVAGGPSGSGRPAPVAHGGVGTLVRVSVLELLLVAFADDADRISMADVRACLVDHDPEKWGRLDGETESAYTARVGKLLAADIEEALEGTGVELAPKSGIRFGKDDTGREIKGSGLFRKDVQAAVDAARNQRK
jgi:S-DNA-T family DNA segregation ATPase FtsK/SpoIIIE